MDPAEVIGENDFGNLMIKDVRGRYWRICPEDPSCEMVATNRPELDRLTHDQEFLRDWYMEPLVEQARSHLGPLAEGRKYCFAIPAILGGAYDISNIKTAPLLEMVGSSGHIAKHISGLPDGTEVMLKVVE